VLTGAWPRTFRLALLHKDLRIAVGLLDEVGVDGPVLEVADDLIGVARELLDPDADYLEPIRVIERQAGVEVRG